MSESREAVTYERHDSIQWIAVPPKGNGTCAVCLHAYDEHSISLDGATQTCNYPEFDAGYPYDCGCLEYISS